MRCDRLQEKPSIQQLENFIIYGKVRNFATAAHIANITQSAFSFQMKKLEEMVGVQLITRSNRGSDLTREGEFFLQKITKIIAELDEAINALQKFSGLTVSVNVGALMSMGDVLMNKHVRYFQQHNDNISINVYNLEVQTMMEKLKSGEIDIASSFLLPQMNLDGYMHNTFYKDEMIFYAPGLKLSNAAVSVETMANFPLASYAPNYFMSRAIANYFSKNGANPQVEARLSTPYAIIQYCRNNPAGALMSRRLMSEMGIDKGWYELKTPLSFDVALFYRQENPKIKSMKIFIDYNLKLYKK